MATISCNRCSLVTTSGRRLLVVTDGVKQLIEIPDAKKDEKQQTKVAGSQPGRGNYILCSRFSPSGKYFAVGDDDKQLHLFETIPRWRLISTRPVARRSTSLTFTHDDSEVIVADKTGDVYKFSIQEEERAPDLILGHLSMVLDLTMTPGNRYVVTCDRDEKIRLSQFPNGYNIHGFCLGHTEFVSQVLYIEEFSCLLSGSGDGTIRAWDLIGQQRLCFKCHSSEVKETPIKRLLYDPHLKVIIVTFYRLNVVLFYSLSENQGQLNSKLLSHLSLDREPWDICVDRKQQLWVVEPFEERPVQLYLLNLTSEGDLNVESAQADNVVYDLLCKSWEFFKDSLDAPDPYTGLQKITMEKNVEEYLAKKQERLEGKKPPKQAGKGEPVEKKIKSS